MPEYSRFFDSTPEDERYYSADEFAEYFRRLLTNGIFNGGTNLQVSCDGNNIRTYINNGFAWIEGYMYKIEGGPFYLTHDLPDTQYDRIDRIVLRLDKSLEVRAINAKVLKGNPAANPVPPALTRNDNVYEISLAQVRIKAGKSYIEAYQITDERLNNNVCGLVNSLIQADTTNIFNQFQAHYNAKSAKFEKDWQTWLDTKLPQFQQQWDGWFNTNTTNYNTSWNTWFTQIKNAWNTFFSNVQGKSYLTGADVGVTVASQENFTAHLAEKATLTKLGHVNHGVLTATLGTNWSGSNAPYTQTISVSGILSTDSPIIDVVMSGVYSTDESRIEAWGYIYRAVTGNGSITFYTTEIPKVNIPIQIKVVR